MSMLLLLMVMVACVNPFRVRLGVPDRSPSTALFVGAGTAIGALAIVAASSRPILDALQISPETYLIGAGVVAVLAGGRTLFFPVPVPEPTLPGWRAGMWPIAYPLVLSPEVLAVSLAMPGQRGAAATTLAAGVAVGVALFTLALPLGEWGRRLFAALGRLLAVMLVVAGVWMIIEGVRDV